MNRQPPWRCSIVAMMLAGAFNPRPCRLWNAVAFTIVPDASDDRFPSIVPDASDDPFPSIVPDASGGLYIYLPAREAAVSISSGPSRRALCGGNRNPQSSLRGLKRGKSGERIRT